MEAEIHVKNNKSDIRVQLNKKFEKKNVENALYIYKTNQKMLFFKRTITLEAYNLKG